MNPFGTKNHEMRGPPVVSTKNILLILFTYLFVCNQLSFPRQLNSTVQSRAEACATIQEIKFLGVLQTETSH